MMDIGLDEGDDLSIQQGDFAVWESTRQHQRQLILNNKGEFKQNPTIGAGVFAYFDDEQMNELVRAISIEFSRDGMDVQQVSLTSTGMIESEAYYK